TRRRRLLRPPFRGPEPARRSGGILRGRFRSAPCRCAWDRQWGGRRSLRGRARLLRGRGRGGLSVSSYAPLQDGKSINETAAWRLQGRLLLLAPQLCSGEVAGEIEVVLDCAGNRLKQPMLFQLGEPVRNFPRRVMRQALLQQIRVRLAVDQTENAALFSGHARIARFPGFLPRLGALIDPVRRRHAPLPGKARSPP